MSFDFSSLQNSLMQSINNQYQLVQNMNAWYTAPAGMISYTIFDPYGNANVYSVPNLAWLNANTLQGVQNAMSLTLYVDQINGNDNNNGFTPSTAFASMGKAFSVVPNGGAAYIYVLNSYTENEIAIVGTNKSIFIAVPYLTFNPDCCWRIQNNNINIFTAGIIVESSPYLNPDNYSAFHCEIFERDFTAKPTYCLITINPFVYSNTYSTTLYVGSNRTLCGIRESFNAGLYVIFNVMYTSLTAVISSTNALLVQFSAYGHAIGGFNLITFGSELNFINTNGSTLSWPQVIGGIVSTAAGTAMNVLSTVNLI